MSLFEKTHIGQLEVKNHFIRSATYEGKATIDGRPTKAIIELYEKLAKGNIGTIITSYSYITKYEQPAKNQLGIYCDDLIEDYRKLVDRVHDCGARPRTPLPASPSKCLRSVRSWPSRWKRWAWMRAMPTAI